MIDEPVASLLQLSIEHTIEASCLVLVTINAVLDLLRRISVEVVRLAYIMSIMTFQGRHACTVPCMGPSPAFIKKSH